MKTALLVLSLALACAAHAQTTGQFTINQRTATTGPLTAKHWSSPALRLWGTDAAGNPHAISLSGATLAGGVLTINAAGSLEWGGIGGNLSAQTDLVAALNARLAASAVSAYGLTLVDDATAADARATLGLGTLATQSGNLADYLTTAAAAGAYQPLDGDLSDIALLSTTPHGRGLLTGANAAATRSTLGLGTLATQSGNLADYLTTAAAAGAYQPLDPDLTNIASLSTTAHGRGLLTGADAAATRSTLGLGTLATQSGNLADYLTTAAAAGAYQPLDADLTDLADGTLSGSKVGSGIDAGNITAGTLPIARGGTGANNAASARSLLGLTIGSSVQAWSPRLQDLADNGYTDAVVLAWGAEAADETVADGVVQFPVPVACSVTDLVLHLGTAATGAAYEVDVRKNGTSIFSTRLTIDDGETSSATAFTPYALSGPVSLAAGDILRVDVKQIGATTAGKGPKLVLVLNR